MVKVLGLGDNVCDVYLHTGTMYPGGQALNVAVYAEMLGAKSDFLGVIGTDEAAAHVLTTLDQKGIGHSRIRVVQGENGIACVTLEEGDRVFVGSNRGGVLRQFPINLDKADLDYVNGFDVVHITNNGFTDSQLPLLASCVPFVSYDFSGRWNEEDRVERVCPFVDFGFLSGGNLPEEELVSLCKTLHNKGCGTVVATRGGKGAIAWDGVRLFRQPSDSVKVVDTMGAGDSFAACVLVCVANALEHDGRASWNDPEYRGRILPEAMVEAAGFAAKTCLTHGAFGCGTAVPLPLKPVIDRVVAEARSAPR